LRPAKEELLREIAQRRTPESHPVERVKVNRDKV
jgi:hypothetical protein